jgi:hypothetical protein
MCFEALGSAQGILSLYIMHPYSRRRLLSNTSEGNGLGAFTLNRSNPEGAEHLGGHE